MSRLPLEKRALAATADGKRRSAGQRERIDAAIDLSRLLSVAEAEEMLRERQRVSWRDPDLGNPHAGLPTLMNELFNTIDAVLR